MRLRNRIKVKPGQLLPTFDYTITVLNRLKIKDSETKQDVWYATVINNCAFYNKAITSVNGNTVSMGGTYKALIPKQHNYLPYNQWKNTPDNHVTFSEGDYIIKGTLSDDEVLNANTIRFIIEDHKPNAFQIRSFGDYTETIEAAEHYELEGV